MSVQETDVIATGGRHRRPSGEPPPLPHEINRVAVGWMIAFVFWSVLWAWIFFSDDPARWITARDLELMEPVGDHRQSWLDPVMQRGSHCSAG